MHSRLVTLAVFVALVAACGASPSPSCDVAAMRDRIGTLASGEMLELDPSCVLEGSLTIPAGATVRGGAFVLGAADAISLTPSADATRPTTFGGASIEGGSEGASLVVRGAGHARIESTTLEATRGIAVGVAEATVTIDALHVTGNVDLEDVLEVPVPAPASEYAIYGVAVTSGAHVTLTHSEISRVASAGIVCTDATLTLDDVLLEDNRGFGMEGFACTVASATATEVARTIAAPSMPGMGIALAMGSTLESTSGLHVHDAPGFGLFVTSSQASLTGAIVERMGTAGAWAEDGSTLRVSDATFTDNRGTAIAAVGAERLEVVRTSVTGTGEALLPTSLLGAETVGDAIHVAQTPELASTISIDGATLVDNARVGLIVDGGGEALALTIASTSVEGTGAELGAVAQNVADLPATWDSGVTRTGSAIDLDPSAGPLVVSDGSGAVGVLMPPTISF